jgi:hypothetical protein
MGSWNMVSCDYRCHQADFPADETALLINIPVPKFAQGRQVLTLNKDYNDDEDARFSTRSFRFTEWRYDFRNAIDRRMMGFSLRAHLFSHIIFLETLRHIIFFTEVRKYGELYFLIFFS